MKAKRLDLLLQLTHHDSQMKLPISVIGRGATNGYAEKDAWRQVKRHIKEHYNGASFRLRNIQVSRVEQEEAVA